MKSYADMTFITRKSCTSFNNNGGKKLLAKRCCQVNKAKVPVKKELDKIQKFVGLAKGPLDR